MRPVTLEMQGFGAFRASTTVDFDDTDFFALVGPTGSGKSTVIDAVCFALYGSVPRYDDKRLVASAMSVGHAETKVRLTFEVGGARYVAFRWVRRAKDGKVTTKEARLEGPDGRALVDKARDLDARIEALLGLPFDHFTRCVVLPQGAFAQLLHDRPADRQQLLVQLLDLGVYDRMATAANQRSRQATLDAHVARRSLEALAGATPQAVDEVAAALAGARERAARLAALAPRLAAAEAAVLAAGEARDRAVRVAEALAAVEVPADARHLGAQVAAAAAALAEAEQAAAAASVASEVAAAAVAELPTAAGLRADADLWEQLSRARSAHDAAAVEAAAADLALTESAADLATALQAAAEADAANEAARTASAAHAVRQALHDGDDCPVCGQPVATVPHIPPPPAWQEAAAVAQAAAGAVDAARSRWAAAGRAQASAAERLAGLAERVAASEAAVAGRPAPAELARLNAAVAQAAEVAAGARGAEQAAQAAVGERRAQADAARAALEGLGSRFHAQRDVLAALEPPMPAGDVLSSWQALAAWAAERLAAHQVELAGLDECVADARARRAELGAALAELAEAAGEPRAAGVEPLRQVLAKHEAALEARLHQLRDQVAEAARLDAEAAAAEARAAVAHLLGQLLSANGFEKWLVAEALEALVAGAAATLRQLSGGQYTLATDASGDFVVVDHANGDERRPVRTLSGGETFQASLALALALADHLAGLSAAGTAKLEALFLDEGFGTLDAESLDTVASAIEALGATGRMVGIVTHVRELAERVPVRYEVRKAPLSSTVTRVVG